MANNNSTMVLGFTGSFYAIWTISTESIPKLDCYGNPLYTYDATYYSYGRKVSKYLDKALKKYPNISVLDILENRHHSFVIYGDKVYVNNDTFRYGKHAGKKIYDCDDLDYIKWYYSTIEDENHKNFVENYLVKKGFIREVNRKKVSFFYINNVKLKSPSDIRKENENNYKMNLMINKIKDNSTFSFNPSRNLNEDGNYIDGNVIYHFSNIKGYCYNDFYYWLPVLKNTGKKIKNKEVKVLNFSYNIEDGKLIIEINDFKVL